MREHTLQVLENRDHRKISACKKDTVDPSKQFINYVTRNFVIYTGHPISIMTLRIRISGWSRLVARTGESRNAKSTFWRVRQHLTFDLVNGRGIPHAVFM
jgi:hypothetical protein